MRRTILSVVALACTAVLAGSVPAFADGTAPAPTPTAATAPAQSGTAAPKPTPTRSATPAPTAAAGGVSVVPKGAPDTGVPPVAERSGVDGAPIGAGAAALVIGGAAVYLVRRRRSAQA